MPGPTRFRFLAILFAFTLLVGIARIAVGQESIAEPRMSIAGPDQQEVLVTVRYFDDETVSKTVTSRLRLGALVTDQELEPGHTGIRVFVAVPTKNSVTVTLAAGQEESKSISSIVETLEASIGLLGDQGEYTPPRAILNQSEKKLASRFLSALSAADTRTLVSPLPVANIDWQTLDAYCEAVNFELGEPLAVNDTLDGWLSWDGRLGARVLSGVLQFDRGTCRVSIMVVDEKLVDVIVDSVQMPEDWFQGPSSQDRYVQDAVQLTELLFSDSVAEAHGKFSSRYHKTVTPEKLQDLMQQLRERFGNVVRNTKYKHAVLGDYDAPSRSRTLSIFHAFEVEDDRRCISKVDVVFPCGPNIISRGHLESIHVRETWQSAAPELATLTQTALDVLAPSGATRVTAGLDELLSPQIAAEIDRERLEQWVEKFPIQFGTLLQPPDWDMWASNAVGDMTYASGELQLDKGVANARFDFANGALVGVSIVGRDAASSTLDFVLDSADAEKTGVEFWKSLFAGDLRSAHRLLAPVFQTQMPLDKFQELHGASRFSEPTRLTMLDVSAVRFADRIDRSIPSMVSVYYRAELDDGSQIPLRCEFRKTTATDDNNSGRHELLTFNTDFQASFPVDQEDSLQALIRAFESGSAQNVIALLNERDRTRVETPILDGFMKKLRTVAGKLSMPTKFKLMVEYGNGTRLDHLSCVVPSEIGAIPLAARFEFGKLKSFEWTSTELSHFIDSVQDQSCFERITTGFVEHWLRDEPNLFEPMMINELRTAEVREQLAQTRVVLSDRHGPFQSAEITRVSVSDTENTVQLQLAVKFEHGNASVLVGLVADAFTARVQRVQLD